MQENEENIENEKKSGLIETGDSYRDSVSNIDKKGHRVWIRPQKPKGRFHRARAIFATVALSLFFVMPFVTSGGKPLFLINIIGREFIFFGKVWWPQDFYIFAIGFLMFMIFIVLFTAIYGRLFCGWACPQTVFMEMVFRKIEFLIEGPPAKQIKLKNQKMNAGKFLRKAFKHIVFYAVALVIIFFLFSYFISIDGMYELVITRESGSAGGYLFYFLFSGLFYAIFAWFREQACIYVCPYGRLQSVLIDKNTIAVAYDHKRGEPRAKKNSDLPDKGDCIDCGACVRVCPTGIDIRNGIQLECVNCTACMDACDGIMNKVEKPRGLVRYASIEQIETRSKFRFTPRMMFYSGVLTLLLGVFSFMILSRTDIEASILRARGSEYNIAEDGKIANLYNFKLINKTYKPMLLRMEAADVKGEFEFIGMDSLIAAPNTQIKGTFLLKISKEYIKSSKNKIEIAIYSGDEEVDRIETNFKGPDKYKRMKK